MTDGRTEGEPRSHAICVVDDDPWVLDSLSVLLKTLGFDVLTFNSGAELMADQRRRSVSCVIVDHHMPGLSGLDVIEALRREGNSVPTILITGRSDAGIAQRAVQFGVAATLEKPFSTTRLVELIRAGQGRPEPEGSAEMPRGD